MIHKILLRDKQISYDGIQWVDDLGNIVNSNTLINDSLTLTQYLILVDDENQRVQTQDQVKASAKSQKELEKIDLNDSSVIDRLIRDNDYDKNKPKIKALDKSKTGIVVV